MINQRLILVTGVDKHVVAAKGDRLTKCEKKLIAKFKRKDLKKT